VNPKYSPDGRHLVFTSPEQSPGGDIYVADTWNNRVRKISPDGLITTVAEPIGPL